MVPGRWRGGTLRMYLTGPAQGWGDNAVWFAFINATLPAVDNCAVGGVATCKAVNYQWTGGSGQACCREVWDRDGPCVKARPGTRGLFSLVPFW